MRQSAVVLFSFLVDTLILHLPLAFSKIDLPLPLKGVS